MNEEALKAAYELFASKGYSGTIEQFSELISTNDEALGAAYDLFSSKGYKGDPDHFSGLMGIKKKDDSGADSEVSSSAQGDWTTIEEKNALDPRPQKDIEKGFGVVTNPDAELPVDKVQVNKDVAKTIYDLRPDLKPRTQEQIQQEAGQANQLSELEYYSGKMSEADKKRQLEQEKAFLKAKEQGLTLEESLWNTLGNSINQLGQVDDRAKWLYGLMTDNKEMLGEAEKVLRTQEQYNMPTAEFTAGRKDETVLQSAGRLVGATTNALAAFGTSAIESVSTAGVGLAADMIGESVRSWNQEKAEKLGVSIEELMESGKADVLAPATIGFFAYRLEKMGLKGVRDAIKAMPKGVVKKLITILNSSTVEAGTEWLQFGLDEANKVLGKQAAGNENDIKGVVTAGAAFFSALFSREGLERAIQGAVGGAGGTVAGSAANNLHNKFRGAVKTEEELKQQSDALEEISDIEDMRHTVDLTQDQKDALDSAEEIKKKEIAEINERHNKLFDVANDSDRRKVVEIDEQRIELNKKLISIENSNMTREQKDAAIAPLRKEFYALTEQIAQVREKYINKETGEVISPSPVEVKQEKSKETVGDAINRPVTLTKLGGSELETPIQGDMYVDGQQVVVEDAEGNITEIGNVDEVSSQTLEEAGIETAESNVKVNSNGNIELDGQELTADKAGIKKGKNGEVSRVVLTSPDGSVTKTLRGADAEEAAYQILLKEAQTPEQVDNINQLLEQDEEFQNELRQAEAVAEEQTSQDTEQVDEQQQQEEQVIPDQEQEKQKLEEKFVEPETKSRVSNALKALSKVLPNVSIVVHDNRGSYDKAVGEEGLDEKDKSNGAYVHGKDSKVIHIDGTNANEKTVAHEVFHALILNMGFKDISKTTNAMIKAVNKVASKELKDYLTNFSAGYEQDIQSEEQLAELFGILASSYKTLSKPEQSTIKRWLDSLAKKFGLKEFTDAEVIDVLNTLAGKVGSGEVIFQEDISPLNQNGVNGTIDGNSVKRKSLIGAIDLKRFPVNKNTKLEEGVPLSKFAGKTANVIESDRMTGAYIEDTEGNPLYKFFGGLFYPIITGKMWASRNLSKAKAIANNANNNRDEDGYVYIAPLIMKPGSHMSNQDMFNTMWAIMKHDLRSKSNKLTKEKFVEYVEKALSLKALKGKGESLSIKKTETIESLIKKLDKVLVGDDKTFTFQQRKTIVKSLLGDAKVKEERRFPSAGSIQELASKFEEDITKGKDLWDLAVVFRTKGTLDAKITGKNDEFYHPSYPAEIFSDAPIEVAILDGGYSVTTAIPSMKTAKGIEFSWEDYKERHGGKSMAVALAQYGRTGKLGKASGTISEDAIRKQKTTPEEQKVADGFPIRKQKRTKPEPKKTIKAYKMFRIKKNQPGKLFPLFVNADEYIEIGTWIDAKVGELNAQGKVKSKIGALAYRPGWHMGDLPIATHIGDKYNFQEGKVDKTLKKPTARSNDHVWAEVEVAADVDWQTEANKRANKTKDGKIVPRTAHITDQVPEDGYYRYKTNPNMTGNWIISGSIKVNRILTDSEVKAINDKAGVADLPRVTPIDLEAAGFTVRKQKMTPEEVKQAEKAKADHKRSVDKERELINKKITAKGTFRKTAEAVWDRQFSLKIILKKIQKEWNLSKAKDAYNALITAAGASANANARFQEVDKDIFEGMSKKDRALLNEVVDQRRLIAINENRRSEGKESYLRGEKEITDVEAKARLKQIEIELGERKFSEINKKADKVFQVFKDNLDRMYESGRLDEESYNRFLNIEYSPIAVIKYIINDNEHIYKSDVDRKAQIYGLTASDIKKLGDKNKDERVLDIRWLMMMHIASTEKKFFQNLMLNKFNQAFEAAPEAFSNVIYPNPIVGTYEKGDKKGQPKYKYNNPIEGTDIPGTVLLSFFDQGRQRYMVMEEQFAKQLLDVRQSDKALRTIGKFTGSKVLRTMATGANAFFAVGNSAIDFANILFFTDVYGDIKFLSGFELAYDAGKAALGKMIKSKTFKEIYRDFLAHGGGMDYLAVDGIKTLRDKQRSRALKGISKGKLAIGNALSWLGETSEMAFRVAVYEKELDNQKKRYKKEEGTEAKGTDLENLKFAAAAKARGTMDFAQGGHIIKQADQVFPYLNAGMQGFRKPFDFLMEDPKRTMSSIIQIASYSAATPLLSQLIMASLLGNGDDDDEEKIKEKLKEFRRNLSDFEKAAYITIPYGIDEDGNVEYARIRKHPMAAPLMTLAEEAMYSYMDTGEMDMEAVGTSVQNSMPMMPADIMTRNPFMASFYTYYMNKDSFTGQTISYDKENKNILPMHEGAQDPDVNEFYKLSSQGMDYIGMKTDTDFLKGGFSPIRAQAAIGKWVTTSSTNPAVGAVSALVDNGLKLFTEEGDVKDGMKGFADEFRRNFKKKFARTTSPNVGDYKEKNKNQLDRLRAESEIENNQNKIREMIKVGIKDGKIKQGDLVPDYIRKEMKDMFPRETYPRMVRKYNRYINNFNTPRKIFEIGWAENPEIQARLIYDYYGKFDPKEFKEVLDSVKKVGGRISQEAKVFYRNME